MSSLDLAALVLLWVIATACYFIVYTRQLHGTVGLTLACVAGLFLNHWFGAATYLMPVHFGGDEATTTVGFVEASVGLAGVLLGSLVSPGLRPRKLNPGGAETAGEAGLKYLAIGLTAYFVLLPWAGYVPSASAVVSSGLGLAIAGLTLGCWQACVSVSRKGLMAWLLGATVLPVLTVLIGGFLGFGAIALLTLAMAVAGFYRPRWHVVVAAIALTYFGLSVYVTYMSARVAIREVVWGGEGYGARLGIVSEALAGFRFFDPTKPDQLVLVDQRMNQNQLVGSAVEYIATGGAAFAHGTTIADSVLALIPRILWADKPSYAGSGDLVADYTGITFAEETSVGIGVILELYVNFGRLGVLLGCAVIGAVLTIFDRLAASHLRAGDHARFVAWYVPGVAFQQLGGSLVEVTAGVAGAFVAAALANEGLRAWRKRKD